MGDNIRKDNIKACIAIAVVILIILLSILYSVRYQVEGEINMPFKLSKITVVSTAEGVENEGTAEKWNLSIYQNNDIYFSIEKNERNKEECIVESVSIENIQIVKEPEIGQVRIYMPNSSDGRLFTYTDDTIINDNKLIYKGALKTNNKTLEIGNQGGTVVIRFSNADIGKYISNEDEEIKHDGTMLAKTDATNENIKFTVNFDVIIKLKNSSYKTNITLDLPSGDKLIEDGTSSQEIVDNFIFKRI